MDRWLGLAAAFALVVACGGRSELDPEGESHGSTVPRGGAPSNEELTGESSHSGDPWAQSSTASTGGAHGAVSSGAGGAASSTARSPGAGGTGDSNTGARTGTVVGSGNGWSGATGGTLGPLSGGGRSSSVGGAEAVGAGGSVVPGMGGGGARAGNTSGLGGAGAGNISGLGGTLAGGSGGSGAGGAGGGTGGTVEGNGASAGEASEAGAPTVAGPSTWPQAEVAWGAVGALVVDGAGTPFLDDSSGVSVSRVDLSTGEPVWTRRGEDYFQPLADCGAPANTISSHQSEPGSAWLVAVDPVSGETLWTTNLEGRISGYGEMLTCAPDADYVVFQSRRMDSEWIGTVSRGDGSLRWTLADTSGWSVAIVTRDVVVLHSDLTSEPVTVVGYQAADGTELWRQNCAGSIRPFASDGEFYLVLDDAEVRRLRLDDGTTQWSYNGGSSLELQTIHGGLFAHRTDGSGQAVARLGREDGSTMWSFYWQASSNADADLCVVRDLSLYVRETLRDLGSAMLGRANVEGGALDWLLYRDYAYPPTLDDGQLFMFGRDEAIRLDPDSGAVLWTTVLEHIDPDVGHPGAVGGIVASSPSHIYVGYHEPGTNLVSAGVVKLERETGELVWGYAPDSPMGVRFEDDERLYVTPYPGTTTYALLK